MTKYAMKNLCVSYFKEVKIESFKYTSEMEIWTFDKAFKYIILYS